MDLGLGGGFSPLKCLISQVSGMERNEQAYDGDGKACAADQAGDGQQTCALKLHGLGPETNPDAPRLWPSAPLWEYSNV